MDAALANSLNDALHIVSNTFYSNCVTFEMAKERNIDGFVTREWKPVPHPSLVNQYLVNLPCSLAPDANWGGQTKRRSQTHTKNTSRQKLALVGYYPNLTKAFRAVVDGKAWDIVGIANDNNLAMLIFLDETSA